MSASAGVVIGSPQALISYQIQTEPASGKPQICSWSVLIKVGQQREEKGNGETDDSETWQPMKDLANHGQQSGIS